MIFSRVRNISLQPLLDELGLLLAQKPGTGSTLRQSQHGDQAKEQRDRPFDNKQPPPSLKPLPLTHKLDTIRNKPPKSARYSRGSIEGRDPFPLATARIDRREQERQRRHETRFQEAKQQTASNQLAVIMAEPCADRHGAPAYDCNREH